MGLVLAAFGIFVIFALSLLVGNSSAAFFLLSVSFMAFGLLMFTMPVTLLYVYDKNNGVLEYLLSLGWNQSDIFKQYLKAALFLALTLFIAEGAAILIAGAIAGSTGCLSFGFIDAVSYRVFGFFCGFIGYNGYDGFQLVTEATSRRQHSSCYVNWRPCLSFRLFIFLLLGLSQSL